MFQLTQDPVTGVWNQSNITLPATDVNNIIKYNSFITQAWVNSVVPTDLKQTKLSVLTTSPIGVLINDFYYSLHLTIPVLLDLTQAQSFSIVQSSTNTLAIRYQLDLLQNKTKLLDTVKVDPAAKLKLKLASIQSRSDLDNAKIKRADRSVVSLVPSEISSEDRGAVAATLKQFSEVTAKLPDDGSRADLEKGMLQQSDINSPFSHHVLGAAAAEASARQFTVESVPATGGSELHMHVSAGDFFRTIAHGIWETVKGFVVKVANGIATVVAKIGNYIYTAILDCAAAVSHAFEFVFSKIKVFVEDLIRWAGFIFNWSDIVRTHKVIKNVVTQYARHSIDRINDLKAQASTAFDGLEKNISTWAGLQPRISLGWRSGIFQHLRRRNEQKQRQRSRRLGRRARGSQELGQERRRRNIKDHYRHQDSNCRAIRLANCSPSRPAPSGNYRQSGPRDCQECHCNNPRHPPHLELKGR